MKSRRGFTLVELLTVIAIIAVLMAILSPVFLTAKAAVFRYQAASQLKQIGMVMTMYAGDHDDLLPPYRSRGYVGAGCDQTNCLNPDYAHDLVAHGSAASNWYGELSRDTIFFNQIIRPYIKADSVFHSRGQLAPWVGADRNDVSSERPEHRSYGAQNSYALNWYLFTNPIGYDWNGGGLALSSVNDTSKTMLMLDGSFYLALPRKPGILNGNYDATAAACYANYPQYWKNIGNSSLFGKGGHPSNAEAMRRGPTRYNGMLVQLRLDGSTKMKSYDPTIYDLEKEGPDSFWDPYKLGFTPCEDSE